MKNIRILNNDQINFPKWDTCIAKSFNGNIFALSWYLDIIHDDWQAIILNDYEAVMPIFSVKKFKFQVIIKPKFSGRQGIFTNKLLSKEITNLFWDILTTTYHASQVNLNLFSYRQEYPNSIKHEEVFYLLDTTPHFTQIFSKYDSLLKKDFEGLKNEKLVFTSKLMPNRLIELGLQNKLISQKEHGIIRMISASVVRHQQGNLFGVYNKYNTLTAALLIAGTHHTRDILFAVCENSTHGKLHLSALINHCIRIYSEKGTTFIISKNSGLLANQISTQFGFQPSVTQEIHHNSLPWYAKKIMKF